MKRAAIFPGQGAQQPGMGQDLAESFPEARDLFAEADERLGFPLSETCFSAPAATLNRTDVCQPGIFLVSAVTMEVLKHRLDVAPPDFGAAAGLSLGEYTALWFAGALSFADGLALTRLRGELMQQASEAEPSGMTSVIGADLEVVEEACRTVREEGGVVCVANLNCPGQIVISGAKPALERATALLKEAGVRRTIPLSVAGAFHSPLMASAAEGLAARLEETEIRVPDIPVFANVSAEPVAEPEVIRKSLVRQLTSPVLWARSMESLLKEGHGEFVEPGPGTVLSGLMKKIDRSALVRGYPDAAAIRAGGVA